MQVDLSAVRQAIKGEAKPKTEVRGRVNNPEQQGNGATAGIFLVFMFAGASAAFFGGILKMNS
jgi:hypothetical protein